MDDETRAAFARMNRWFELNQSQYNDLRQDIGALHAQYNDMRQDIGALHAQYNDLRQDIGALHVKVDGLSQEFHRFRDWAAERFGELRYSLQQLTARVDGRE